MNTSGSILVVDDQLDLANAVRQALELEGYQVFTAGDGLEALAVLRTRPVDLILADIAMPNMNGYQLHKRIIENPRWVAIPFIVLSGRDMDSDIRYGKELGVDDYLTKPIKLKDLLAVVRGRLRRARQLAYATVTRPASRSTAESNIWTLGELQIAPDQYQVWRNGEPVNLSVREFKLLRHLARRANKVAPLQSLARVTHELETDQIEAGVLVRPLIRSLRRKLGYVAGEMGCIENVRGIGYKLIV